MRLATLAAGVTSLTNKEVETALHKLVFTFTTPTADVPAGSGSIRSKAAAEFASICGSAALSIVKQSASGNENLMTKLLIKDIAEISTNHEGVVEIDLNDAGTHYVCKFTVEISEFAFRLDDSAKLIINLENKVSNAVLDIDAMDHPVTSSEYIKYENKYVNENTPKDFPVGDHYLLAVPDTNYSSLDLHYSSGRVISYTRDEIRQMVVDSEEEVIRWKGLHVGGYAKWICILLEGVNKITVTNNANSNIMLLRKQSA